MFCEYVTDPGKVFSDYYTQVDNDYLLDNSDYYGGMCIYFKTNKGDYVLYSDCLYANADDNDFYLIPKEEFHFFAKDCFEKMKGIDEESNLIDGTITIGTTYDLSQYMFKENALFSAYLSAKNVFVISAILLFVAIIVVTVICFIKKEKNVISYDSLFESMIFLIS